ncbi:MAG: 4-hydroxybenzoate octaprenyltransferase, partial [Alphaproteobacteria bacterium]
MADTKLDDSMPDSWVKRLPEGWRPYLRLARLDR